MGSQASMVFVIVSMIFIGLALMLAWGDFIKSSSLFTGLQADKSWFYIAGVGGIFLFLLALMARRY